jgi:glutaredoxin
MTIEVLDKDNCIACDRTEKFLDREGLPYTTQPVTPDNSLGYRSAPVVIIRQAGEIIASWSGYQRERLQALATA